MAWESRDILALRQRLELSQTEFAALIGVRQATVSDWERGTRKPHPMAEQLLTLAAKKRRKAATQ